MKLKNCPRCEQRSYEFLKTYGVCHDCNYNTVEDHSWNRARDQMRERSIIDVPEIPDETGLRSACSKLFQMISPGVFTRTDYAILRDALRQLSEVHRKIVALRFWENFELQEIAQQMQVNVGFVERNLKTALNELKERCLARPAFSRSPENLKIVAEPSMNLAA